MRGYVTKHRFRSYLNVPIALAQTELRRGRYLNAGQVLVEVGQVMRVSCLNLHLISILTPTVSPSIFNTPLGMVSAGIYLTPMACSSACLLATSSPGVVSTNYFACRDFGPGLYYFVVSNNCSNCDVAVCLTGAAKLINR
jgi:hypothetical protein